MQNEIRSAGMLLDNQGRLVEAGYAYTLRKTYLRSMIKAGSLRIKEWDYYLVNDEAYAVALTIADNGYMGVGSISLIDFSNRKEMTKTRMRLFPMGGLKLPSSSAQGLSAWSDKQCRIRFLVKDGIRTLEAEYIGFYKGENLTIRLQLDEEPKDTMVIMTPFPNDPHAFYYNQKINCLRVKGIVSLGNWSHVFDKNAFGCLDWGRGVWTYDNTWYWSSCSSLLDGHRLGWNLGYGFGDTQKASENMLFYDGTGYKLDRVMFHIPQDADHVYQYMEPWRLEDNEGRLQLTFVPLLDRKAKINAGFLLSDQHQVFGRFSGYVLLDKKISVLSALGFAERVHNRW